MMRLQTAGTRLDAGYSTDGEPDFLDVEEEMIEERNLTAENTASMTWVSTKIQRMKNLIPFTAVMHCVPTSTPSSRCVPPG